jgi:hypothetical protein
MMVWLASLQQAADSLTIACNAMPSRFVAQSGLRIDPPEAANSDLNESRRSILVRVFRRSS